jgi:serine/threonine protein kinase
MFIETLNQVIFCLMVPSERRLGDLNYLVPLFLHQLIPCVSHILFLQISDFGLAKLVVKSSDAEASVTKVVGTFGYLAPE